MSVPQKLMVNKSMTSLVLASQSSQYYRKKSYLKRSKSSKLNKKGYIYPNSTKHSSSKMQSNHTNRNMSKIQSHSDESDYIDPAIDYTINQTIKNSFYTMYENYPFEILNISKKYFQLKKINNNNTEIELMEEQSEWFYENEKQQTELFYKQIGLSFEDVITNFKERDIVLHKRTYKYESLGDMNHYFILLYYGIKEYTIEQLQDLWIKLYKLFYNKTKQNQPIPTIYIDFKNGQIPTNINNIFNMLFDKQFGIDLYKLKSVIKQYYYQYNPKCIHYKNIQQKVEIKSMFDNVLISDISMEKIPQEYEAIIGYNRNEFMSIIDQSFPFIESNIEESITPAQQDENTIFRFVTSKTAVVASLFGVAATVGMRIIGGNKSKF